MWKEPVETVEVILESLLNIVVSVSDDTDGAAVTNGVDVTEYSPKKIKLSVSGSGNASKEQVAAMLESILKVKFDNQYLDASDALAAALCHYYQSTSVLKGKKRYNDWSAYLKDNPGKVR